MSQNNQYLPVLSGNMPHHLDHLAPFAWKYQVPLWIEDKKIALLAKEYYPGIEIIAKPFDLNEAEKISDTIVVSTKNAPRELKDMASAMGKGHMQFAYLPHGQSDKGLNDKSLRSIQHADIAFLYGDLQWQRLKQFGTLPTIGNVQIIGNLRKEYYEKYRETLDQITHRKVFATLDPKKQTLLYAPTWSSDDFTLHTLPMIETLTAHYNLIVKLHPLMERTHPAHKVLIEEMGHEKNNLQVLSSFPLIYPLLARTDIYIGDESAIGYDFLHFNKPMFFITTSDSPLHNCGRKVHNIDELRLHIKETQTDKEAARQKFIAHAFEWTN